MALSLLTAFLFVVASVVVALPGLHEHHHDGEGGAASDPCLACMALDAFAAAIVDFTPILSEPTTQGETFVVLSSEASSEAPASVLRCRGPPAV